MQNKKMTSNAKARKRKGIMGEGKLASVLYQLHQDLRRRQRSMRKTYGTN